MKKVIICIAIVLGALLPAGISSASPASKFDKWIIATNPIIQKFLRDNHTLGVLLSAGNVAGSTRQLAIISRDGTMIGTHTNSGDLLLNVDVTLLSRSIIHMTSVGFNTLDGGYGGSFGPWSSAVHNVTVNEGHVTSDLNYDAKRFGLK
jgi:hypothetical protein